MLQCVHCGAQFPTYPLRSNCEKCAGTLEYRADLPQDREVEFSGPLGFWRYRRMLPPVQHMISLGEGGTPLTQSGKTCKSHRIERALFEG